MIERLGVNTEWPDKSKLAYAKLQRMLDPGFKFDFADPTSAGTPDPGPTAASRPRRRPSGRPRRVGIRGPLGPRPPSRPTRQPTGTERQIL